MRWATQGVVSFKTTSPRESYTRTSAPLGCESIDIDCRGPQINEAQPLSNITRPEQANNVTAVLVSFIICFFRCFTKAQCDFNTNFLFPIWSIQVFKPVSGVHRHLASHS